MRSKVTFIRVSWPSPSAPWRYARFMKRRYGPAAAAHREQRRPCIRRRRSAVDNLAVPGATLIGEPRWRPTVLVVCGTGRRNARWPGGPSRRARWPAG